VDHIKSVFASQGSDSWWSLPLKQLLPDNVISQVLHFRSVSAGQLIV